MRIVIAALFTAALVAPIHPANAQNPPPYAGVRANCWVDMLNGGAMVIPHAVTQAECATAAMHCLGLQPHGVVHHSNQTRLVQADSLAECELNGR